MMMTSEGSTQGQGFLCWAWLYKSKSENALFPEKSPPLHPGIDQTD